MDEIFLFISFYVWQNKVINKWNKKINQLVYWVKINQIKVW